MRNLSCDFLYFVHTFKAFAKKENFSRFGVLRGLPKRALPIRALPKRALPKRALVYLNMNVDKKMQ